MLDCGPLRCLLAAVNPHDPISPVTQYINPAPISLPAALQALSEPGEFLLSDFSKVGSAPRCILSSAGRSHKTRANQASAAQQRAWQAAAHKHPGPVCCQIASRLPLYPAPPVPCPLQLERSPLLHVGFQALDAFQAEHVRACRSRVEHVVFVAPRLPCCGSWPALTAPPPAAACCAACRGQLWQLRLPRPWAALGSRVSPAPCAAAPLPGLSVVGAFVHRQPFLDSALLPPCPSYPAGAPPTPLLQGRLPEPGSEADAADLVARAKAVNEAAAEKVRGSCCHTLQAEQWPDWAGEG
jgi:hypothetical protein